MPCTPMSTSSYQTTTPQYEECSRFFSGTLPQFTAPSFLHSSNNCKKKFSAIYIFVITAHICTTMMRFDHDNFLPPFVKLSTLPYCTNISSQYDGSHYDNSTQEHGTRSKSTNCTTIPLPCKSQHKHLSSVNVHNNRPTDSAHFAQPMSHNSTCQSPTLVHLCNNSPARSTRIVSYIGRQYARTVPIVDIVGSSKCHTRHLATGGVARFNDVLVTNLNPVMTCASDGQVNPYPNNV
jgi:hypothetical protein